MRDPRSEPRVFIGRTMPSAGLVSGGTTLPDVCELGGLGTRRRTVLQTSVTSPLQDA